MDDNKNKKWFERSGFLRWYPVKWQAWLIVIVIAVVILISFFFG